MADWKQRLEDAREFDKNDIRYWKTAFWDEHGYFNERQLASELREIWVAIHDLQQKKTDKG